MDWHQYHMGMAISASKKSKDPSTKCGCRVVGYKNQVLSEGYNGLPRGAVDTLAEREVRPEKYLWYEHAERNAIYNAADVGVPLGGSTLYVTGPPCMDCSRAIVQSGIKRVYALRGSEDFMSRWSETFKRSLQLFSECDVEYIELDMRHCVECNDLKYSDDYHKTYNVCKDCAKIHRAERYEKYSDKEIEYSRQYRRNNKSKVKATNMCRRTKIKNLETDFNEADIKFAMKYFNGKCCYCSVDVSLEVMHWDHYRPVCKGGGTVPENMLPSCGACNLRKGSINPELFIDNLEVLNNIDVFFNHVRKRDS